MLEYAYGPAGLDPSRRGFFFCAGIACVSVRCHSATGLMGKMTLTDADILRAAGVLIHHRGCQAASRAEMRATELCSAGDLDGEATWRRILAAIGQLQGDRCA